MEAILKWLTVRRGRISGSGYRFAGGNAASPLFRAAVLTLMCLLLGACAQIPHYHIVRASGGYSSKENSLLAYANQIQSLSTTKLKTELEHARRAFADHPDGYNRLKLVLLLMTPATPITNYEEAQSLLSNYVENTPRTVQDKTLAPLAKYLMSELNTRSKVMQALTNEREKSRALEHKIQEITAVEGGKQRQSQPMKH